MDRYDVCYFCEGYVKRENLIKVELDVLLEGVIYKKVSVCEVCKREADTK